MLLQCIGENIENVGKDHKGVCGSRKQIPRFLPEQVKDFRSIFKFLNGKDRDILYLVFVTGKKQKDIQRILQRSQPSLCYDIKRIRQRLKFIFYLNSVFDVFLEFIQACSEYFTPEERDVLTLMFYTTCLSQTAKILGIQQVRVRYIFSSALRKLEGMEIWEVYEIFVAVQHNLNIVKRVYHELDENDKLADVFIPI